jgi:hypothetical protein
MMQTGHIVSPTIPLKLVRAQGHASANQLSIYHYCPEKLGTWSDGGCMSGRDEIWTGIGALVVVVMVFEF